MLGLLVVSEINSQIIHSLNSTNSLPACWIQSR